MKRLNAGVAAFALMAAMGAAPVGAQQTMTDSAEGQPAAPAAQRNAPEEIVVTAQKSGVQALQEVPLAIQAFSGEDLKERNINNIADLATAIPGISESQRQSVASRSFSIRGAGAGASNGDSAIGYYVDDVPFVVTNFGIAPPIRFLDLDRVEVLRGPQGTLYGQGSAGGVFIFHTRDPDLNDIKFAVEAQASQTKGTSSLNYGVAGVVSIPIIQDVLAVRVSGGHSYNPGWADEYYGAPDGTPDREGVNEVRDDDIRVVALFRPVDNLNIRAQYWHFRPRQQFLGGLASTNPPYYANTAAQPSFGNGDFKLYSLSAELDFDTFSISSATTYLEGNFGIYVPIAPAGAFSSQFFPEMFSQEVRINSTTDGPFHWLIGGALQDGSGPQENYLRIPAFGVDINADNNAITKNWAVYGELGYDLLDGKLRPRVGLRYYHDKRTFEDASTTNTNTENVTTWRVNLSYVPNDDLTVFVTAATGFRPGIVQSQVQADLLEDVGVPAGTQTRPESSTNYEAGIKWRSPDRSLNVGVNVYINKLEDMLTPTPTLNTDVSGFSNFGDGTSKGVDIEMRWRTPIDGLTLGAVANINEGKYDTVDPAVQARLPYLRPGTRLVNTIEENARIDATYQTWLSSEVEGLFNVAWTYNGNRLQTNGQFAKAHSLYSANIGLRYKAYDLTLFGENLSDYDQPTILLNTAGVRPTPRTIGLRLRVNYQ